MNIDKQTIYISYFFNNKYLEFYVIKRKSLNIANSVGR